MAVPGQIAQIVVPADGGGNPQYVVLDWARERLYFINQHVIRSYAIGLATQSPILSQTAYTSQISGGGDVDPLTGSLFIQRLPEGFSSPSNAYPVFRFDPTTLTETGQFGGTTVFPSYPTSVWLGESIVCVQCGNFSYGLVKESVFSGHVAAFRCDTMQQAGFYGNVVSGSTDNRGLMCRGASGPAGGSAFLSWSGGLPTTTIPLYVVTVSPGAENYNPTSWPLTNPFITSATVGTIPAASVDATWSHLQCQSIGYDDDDGNVLMVVSTNDSVANKIYLIKVNSATASVIWATPVPTINAAFLIGLPAYSVSNDVVGLLGINSASLVAADTGAISTSALAGLNLASADFQVGSQSNTHITASDTEALYMIGAGYTQGVGSPVPVAGTPSSFTGYAFLGGIIPTPPPPPPTPAVSAPATPRSLRRWRGQIGINWKGLAFVGDVYSNVLGLSDFENFTEYGEQMQFLITTPPLHNDRKRIFMPRFEIEVEAGEGLSNDTAPIMMLEWSKDGGKTWSTLKAPQSMGKVGEYIRRLRWLNLGQSRTWVFRLTCTDPVRRYIIGTYADEYKSLG